VLKYLARYTHRVAISNSRLVELTESGQVTFRYKDYKRGQQPREMTLEAVEFLRRWVQHVLPRGFVKVRHYGLWSNRQREDRLELCRRLLLAQGWSPGLAVPEASAAAAQPEYVCAGCGGVCLVRRGEIPPQRPGCAAVDTS
jgi:hypothetical protein